MQITKEKYGIEREIMYIKFYLIINMFHILREMSSHRSRKRIREAKRKARPELSSQELWIQHKLSTSFDIDWEKVYRCFFC